MYTEKLNMNNHVHIPLYIQTNYAHTCTCMYFNIYTDLSYEYINLYVMSGGELTAGNIYL